MAKITGTGLSISIEGSNLSASFVHVKGYGMVCDPKKLSKVELQEKIQFYQSWEAYEVCQLYKKELDRRKNYG